MSFYKASFYEMLFGKKSSNQKLMHSFFHSFGSFQTILLVFEAH